MTAATRCTLAGRGEATQHLRDKLERRCRDVEGLAQVRAQRQCLSFFRDSAQLELPLIDCTRPLPTLNASQVFVLGQRQQETPDISVGVERDEPTTQVSELRP